MKTTPILSTLCSRLCLGALAAAGIFGATSPLHAAVTTYTSQSAFVNALKEPAYTEDFTAFSGQDVPSPQSFSFGAVGFTLSETELFGGNDSTIVYSNGSGAEGSVFPRVLTSGDSFVLTFSGDVTGVGGTFFATFLDYNGTTFSSDPLAGVNVTATLATGQNLVLASTATYGTEPFGGFTSTTPITSLTLSAPEFNPSNVFVFLALDNLIVSGTAATPAVPEPSTWALALAGAAGLGLLAYRRRPAAR